MDLHKIYHATVNTQFTPEEIAKRRELVLQLVKSEVFPEKDWERCVERAGRFCPGCGQQISWLCPEVLVCLRCQGLIR